MSSIQQTRLAFFCNPLCQQFSGITSVLLARKSLSLAGNGIANNEAPQVAVDRHVWREIKVGGASRDHIVALRSNRPVADFGSMSAIYFRCPHAIRLRG